MLHFFCRMCDEEKENKQHLGNQLFELVAKLESELCAQITGEFLFLLFKLHRSIYAYF